MCRGVSRLLSTPDSEQTNENQTKLLPDGLEISLQWPNWVPDQRLHRAEEEGPVWEEAIHEICSATIPHHERGAVLSSSNPSKWSVCASAAKACCYPSSSNDQQNVTEPQSDFPILLKFASSEFWTQSWDRSSRPRRSERSTSALFKSPAPQYGRIV